MEETILLNTTTEQGSVQWGLLSICRNCSGRLAWRKIVDHQLKGLNLVASLHGAGKHFRLVDWFSLFSVFMYFNN